MSNPIAVVISDVHYSLATLSLADAVMRQAITTANELNVPLIVTGDLHDTKANMRAECINAMIETFKTLVSRDSYILRGNHDAIHEKSEEHSLNFLRPYTIVIDSIRQINLEGFTAYFIPYQHDTQSLKQRLETIPYGSIVFMHQGIQGSNMGDYIQDKTAIPKEWCSGLRVISGHYHARQDIQCPNGGLFSYVGSPYTLSFGEANDPEKGYQVLFDDGRMQPCPTNVRRHLSLDYILPFNVPPGLPSFLKEGDLLSIKIKGTKEELLTCTREYVAEKLGIKDFRLEFIPTDTKTEAPKAPSLNQNDLLDSMIDSLTNTTDERKSRLKSTWKDLL